MISTCFECSRPIAGHHEDPKVAALVRTREGVESRVYCRGCDDKGGMFRRTYNEGMRED